MTNDLVPLNDKEQSFVDALIANGGNLTQAAKTAGYHPAYSSTLRKRLTKHIIEATQDHFALHAPKAANRIIKAIDDEMPNNINVNAAIALLDRVGITKKDLTAEQGPKIQANIFILPAKEQYQIIDAEYVESEKS